jgi:hypothetical protein
MTAREGDIVAFRDFRVILVLTSLVLATLHPGAASCTPVR